MSSAPPPVSRHLTVGQNPPVTTTPATGADGRQDDLGGGVLGPAYRWVMLSILLAIALAAFDALSIYAALPAIGADLGGVSSLSWVMTSYLLASSIATLAVGPVIDGLGARRSFRVAVVVFFVASAACAAAPSVTALVVARAVQGLGGGMAIAVAISSIGLTFPARLMPRAFAAESLVWAVVGFGGPPVVAVLVGTIGWRGVFLVNLPLTALAAIAGWRRVPDLAPGTTPRLRIDATGLVLVIVFTTASVIGLSNLDRRSWAWLGVAVVSGAAAWRHMHRRTDPLVDPAHLVRPPFGGLHAAAFLVLGGALGVEAYLPIFVRGAEGRSEAVAAFVVVFLTVGWTVGSVLASRLIGRVEELTVMRWALTGLVPGVALAGLAVAHTRGIALVGVTYALVGIGVGALTTTALNRLQQGGEHAELGRVNAAHQFMRSLGITYGIALAGAVLLFMVDRRTGDVEVVRQLLAGEESTIDAAAADAVRAGFAWAHAVGAAIVAVAAVPLWSLHRRRPTAAR